MHIVNTVYGDARGGRWQVLVDYSRWLVAEGHKVTVVMNKKATEPTADLEALGCDIIRIANSGFYDLVATFKVYLLLKKLQPDAILSHGGRSTCLFARAKSRSIPLVAINHSNNVKRSKPADVFFNISDHIEQLVRGYNNTAQHYRVINCPRELINTEPKPVLNGIVQLAYMGQLIQRKGVDVLLDALALLKQQGLSSFHCKIAGSGPEREALQQQCQDLALLDQVEFVGQVSQPVEFLSASQIFCFPTRGEGFPISPIEAFAAGATVIGTDDPGTAELLQQGELGVVCKMGDVAGFAEALKQLIETPSQRLAFAQKAQREYLQRYTPAVAKAQFLKVLDLAIINHRAG